MFKSMFRGPFMILFMVTLTFAIFLGWVHNLSDPNIRNIPRFNSDPIHTQSEHYTIHTIYFPSGKLNCEAFFYMPKTNPKPALIVMAPGFGAQKDFQLGRYADIFAKNGHAVFMFDYRNFGGSEGEPMNFVSHRMQLEDWESALDYISTLKNIDLQKIILWGHSFSGGHVLTISATTKHNISLVISQAPYLRATSSLLSLASASHSSDFFKLSFYGLVDLTRQMWGLTRYYIPIYGPSSSLAMFSSPYAMESFPSLIPKDPRGGWQNKVPASIVLTLILYNPHTFAPDVKVPTLLVYDTQDDFCLADDVKDMSKNMKNVHLLEFTHGHFSIFNESFEENINAQLKFIKDLLG